MLIPVSQTAHLVLSPSLFMCILVINIFSLCIYVALSRFRVAQIDVWSANFLFGSEVEIKGEGGRCLG